MDPNRETVMPPAGEGDPSATPVEAVVETTAVETPESTETPEVQTKSFTQEEVDAIVAKRLARERRAFEKQQREQQLAATPSGVEDEPAPFKLQDFPSPEAYADALAEHKAVRLLQRQQTARQQSQVLEQYHEREEAAREKYDDFEQVAYNPTLPVTDVMAETIRHSEIGPDVIYHLGKNPKEAARISKLPPFLQAKEIGKIEAKLASAPPPTRTTSAPPPITPIAARTTGTPVYDTTDPRSVQAMSTSEWIAAERQRQIRKAQSANRS